MKLYRKIIHPYTEENGAKCSIPEYKGRWFSEESKYNIIENIYNLYKKENETKASFCKRYVLRWEERYVEVSFTTDMDSKIEEIL